MEKNLGKATGTGLGRDSFYRVVGNLTYITRICIYGEELGFLLVVTFI